MSPKANYADIISVDRDAELGVVTRVFGKPPVKGRPPGADTLAHLDGAKSVLSFTIWLMRLTPLLPFLVLFKGQRKKVMDYFVNAMRKNLGVLMEKMPITDLCRSGKEIARAIGIRNPCDCNCHVASAYVWTTNHPNCGYDPRGKRETETVLAMSFLIMYDFDDSYRFRLQDLLGEISIVALKSKPRKELRRVLTLAMSREIDGEATRWLMNPKYLAGKTAILLMPPSWIKWLVKVISELDMSQIRLDEDDLSWAQHKQYNFRGRPYRTLVRNGAGFIFDLNGTGKYVPNSRELVFSNSAINPNG